MTWRDRLLPASFRGAAFFVESSDATGGRRVVEHEIPFSNEAPFSEDLGGKGRGFPLECYVLGDNYMAARDALLAALEGEGPGELIHPYRGTLRDTCASYRVRETSRDGGFATFALEFRETRTELLQPSVAVDGSAKLTVTAEALKTSAGAEFVAKFDKLSSLRGSVTGALTATTSAVSGVLSKAAIPGQTLAELQSSVASINASTAALLDAPTSLVATMTALIADLGAGLLGVAGAVNPLATMLSLYSTLFGTRPTGNTPERVVEQKNFDATTNLIQRVVLAQSSLMAIEQVFATYDEAVAARTAITALIDSHTDTTADDVFPALQDMRRDLVQAVPGESNDLPRLVQHTPRVTLPSLVLAHTLYGNLDREEDLIRRNRIAKPGYVVGGVELEVLSDG